MKTNEINIGKVDAKKIDASKDPRQDPGKNRDKTRPDEGQGSKGNFGDDGDWGKRNEDKQDARRKSSPVPIRKAG